MADEQTYRPTHRTLSPEMDQWLRRKRKNPNRVRQTIAKLPAGITAPKVEAGEAIAESILRNRALGL